MISSSSSTASSSASSRASVIDVAYVTNGLGLGGTAKGLVAHARELDRGRFGVRVVAAREDGPRRAELEDAGIPVSVAHGDPRALARALGGADVVHVFRSGGTEPLVPDACRAARVPVVVETNVFGQVDPSADESLFACHLFVGRMCALRYRRRVGLDGPEFHARHRVSYWPLDLEGLRAQAPPRRDARRALGLDPDRPVVARIGRADDRKWRDLLVDMVPPLLELVPEAQVVLVGATPAKLRRLARRGVLDRVHLFAPVADERRLAELYAAADVFVSAAEIGESMSVAIAEALALGLPVVTCSTPWVDNGQLEQVEEGVTGHVANHPQPFAEAVASLLADDERRARLSNAARARADAMFDVRALTRQLERLYASLLAGEGAPAEWWPSPAELDAFGAEYEERLARAFRPLTERETREAERERLRERVRWAVRAAGAADAELIRAGASSLWARSPAGALALRRRARRAPSLAGSRPEPSA